jgi:hypothetical protein
MLPTRKSSPVRKSDAFTVQLRVPALGVSFPATATILRAEGASLTSFIPLEKGMAVIVDLWLDGARVEVDAVVASCDGDRSVALAFENVDDATKASIDRATTSAIAESEPEARVA